MSHQRSNLNFMATRIWVGASDDHLEGAVEIDVTSLPESPASGEDVDLVRVNDILRHVDKVYKAGGVVLIKCKFGVSRAPTVAYLYCIGSDLPFDRRIGHPNTPWREFRELHYGYYHAKTWATTHQEASCTS